jgi:hypothetical protein
MLHTAQACTRMYMHMYHAYIHTHDIYIPGLAAPKVRCRMRPQHSDSRSDHDMPDRIVYSCIHTYTQHNTRYTHTHTHAHNKTQHRATLTHGMPWPCKHKQRHYRGRPEDDKAGRGGEGRHQHDTRHTCMHGTHMYGVPHVHVLGCCTHTRTTCDDMWTRYA